MDYEKIENLVTKAKLGDEKAKLMLAEEFKPLIINLSKKSFIYSYEACDIQNECYKTLFRCVELYNLERHRFVAYATNAIKNSIKCLIRNSIRRNSVEGYAAYTSDNDIEKEFIFICEDIDDFIAQNESIANLYAAIKKLECSEQEMIKYVYFKECPLIKYAELKGMNYPAAFRKKNKILNKLGDSLLSL